MATTGPLPSPRKLPNKLFLGRTLPHNFTVYSIAGIPTPVPKKPTGYKGRTGWPPARGKKYRVNIPAYPALHADIQWRLVYGSLDQHLSAIRQKQDIAKTIRRLNEELPLTSVRYPVGAARFRE
eukprot:m.354185 g.354185  ORF g.354185 m.354185 type:complete len:124 (+) comp28001_c0_seq15:120-491(+)